MRRFIPGFVLNKLLYIRRRIRVVGIFRSDRKRFLKYYSNPYSASLSKDQVEAHLIFFAHSIEKGLSRENIRYGFGVRAITKLTYFLGEYNKLGFDKNSLAYENAISVLRQYVALHRDNNKDIPAEISNRINLFDKDISDSQSSLAGVKIINQDTKKSNRDKNFKELFLERHSVRVYGSSKVSRKVLEKAVDLSSKTPSVCNRQPARVRIIDKKQKIAEIVKVQGGLTGYGTPPVIMAVTVDIGYFVDITERQQPFIDGGAFAMSLMLALEYYGLASCPINTMFENTRDKKIRKLIGVPDNEVFIMLLAVGHFKKENIVPKSFRYNHEKLIK